MRTNTPHTKKTGDLQTSIVLPSKDEAKSLAQLLPELKQRYPGFEILVVDDGSEDDTMVVCERFGVKVVSHLYSKGNGAAIKSGTRQAKGDVLVFMDADLQHDPRDIGRLLGHFDQGVDMVVGTRDTGSQASLGRKLANRLYNKLASWMTGVSIPDLTSGFRVVDARKFREFLYLLPNGFSYPTTTTMAFLRAGYTVEFVPIQARKRLGKSHIRVVHDGVRFLLIIFKVGTLYSPLKLFFPISIGFFLTGLGYYLYTFIHYNRFTNMSALLFITAVLVFLIGLVSEQITTLMYKDSKK